MTEVCTHSDYIVLLVEKIGACPRRRCAQPAPGEDPVQASARVWYMDPYNSMEEADGGVSAVVVALVSVARRNEC